MTGHDVTFDEEMKTEIKKKIWTVDVAGKVTKGRGWVPKFDRRLVVVVVGREVTRVSSLTSGSRKFLRIFRLVSFADIFVQLFEVIICFPAEMELFAHFSRILNN